MTKFGKDEVWACISLSLNFYYNYKLSINRYFCLSR